MRLIDADALEKDLRHEFEQAYQKFHAAKREDEKTEYGAASVTWLQAIFRVRDAPIVDAVEVVRCKDCAKRHTAECLMEYECVCGAQYSWESDDEFCSGGARSNDD